MVCDDLEGWNGGVWEGVTKGRGYIYMYILIVDLHCCMAETNTTL